MSNARFFVVTLALACGMNAQGSGSAAAEKHMTPATNSTVVEGWRMCEILSSLIQLGFTNHLPLGIVLEGDSLCKSRVPGSSEGINIASPIEQVEQHDSTYAVETRNSVLYVHPKIMKISTINALDLKIPHFASEGTSAQQLGITLWMHLRGVLVPQETSMFAGGGDPE